MYSRLTAAVLILCLASLLVAACGSDDSPTNTGNGGGDPTLTAVSPPGASVGLTVKVFGTSFGSSQGTGGVRVGGIAAVVVSWADTEIEFTVPEGVRPDAMSDIAVTTPTGKTEFILYDITPPNTYRVTTSEDWDQFPCWSPGADWIYFCSSNSGGANWDIHRIPAMGGEAERVTSYEGPNLWPDLNPSTGEMAWSSNENHLGNNTDGDSEIFTGFLIGVPEDQVTMGMITSNGSRDLYPAWANTVYAGFNMVSTWEEESPSGNFVAWRVLLHGNGLPTDLTEGRQPNFSGDGRWVVYTDQDNICKIPTTGGAPTQLTSSGRDWYPHWGWANDKIVFQQSSSTEEDVDIMVMNADGTDVKELIATNNWEYCPSWSPDCSKVVFYARRWYNFDIYVYVVP